MNETTEYSLRLGESASMRTGIFQAGIKIVFAGQVSDSIYSIAIQWKLGNNSLAYNLYFSDRQREILTPSGKITVISVSSGKILFKYGKII